MKVFVYKSMMQDYCDIASFVYQIDTVTFYRKLKKYFHNTLNEDKEYYKEYEDVYDIACNYAIIIVGYKMAYTQSVEHTLLFFGDYANDKVIILDEVKDETKCKYAYIDTKTLLDIIEEVRGIPRSNKIGDMI